MPTRKYSGRPIDGTYQSIDEAPYWQGEGETVDATPDPEGTVTAENVPDPGADETDADQPEPDRTGQTTLDEWTDG